VEALEATYERFSEDTVAEMVAPGFRLLSSRRIPEAMTVFRLNADAHPDSPAAQYNPGEAFRYTGRTERAIEQYERVLELDPENEPAASRLRQLAPES
jgi:tetratricopeptide (TPR) repeat protein